MKQSHLKIAIEKSDLLDSVNTLIKYLREAKTLKRPVSFKINDSNRGGEIDHDQVEAVQSVKYHNIEAGIYEVITNELIQVRDNTMNELKSMGVEL